MHIGHFTPAYFDDDSVIGGAERYTENVVKAVAAVATRPGIQQTVFSLGSQEKSIERNGVCIEIFANESATADLMSPTSRKLWAAMESVDVAHVYQALTSFGAYCAVIAKSLRKPLVMTDLGGGISETMLRHGGLRLADGVISISNFAASMLRAYYDGDHRVIMGPVDVEFFSPSGSTKRDRSALYVGRVLPHKGVDRIIEALPDNMHLRVVGRQYDTDYLRLLARMATGKSVEFVPDASDEMIRAFYRQSGIYVHASTHRDVFGNFVSNPELLGLTTVEALACGMPAIVSDAGSLPEVATDARITRTFRDSAELREHLTLFRDGNWPDGRVDESARAFAVERFGAQAVGYSLLNFYEDLVTSGRR